MGLTQMRGARYVLQFLNPIVVVLKISCKITSFDDGCLKAKNPSSNVFIKTTEKLCTS